MSAAAPSTTVQQMAICSKCSMKLPVSQMRNHFQVSHQGEDVQYQMERTPHHGVFLSHRGQGGQGHSGVGAATTAGASVNPQAGAHVDDVRRNRRVAVGHAYRRQGTNQGPPGNQHGTQQGQQQQRELEPEFGSIWGMGAISMENAEAEVAERLRRMMQ